MTGRSGIPLRRSLKILSPVWELPQKEAELERLERELERLRQEINERQEKLRHLKSITFDLCTKVYKLGEIVDKEIKKWRV